MQPLPYYDEYVHLSLKAKFLTIEQINWFVALIYFACSLLTIQLCLALYNCYAFLYTQKKYKTLPLLLFYTLTVLLTLARISYNVMQFGFYIDQYIVVVMMPIIKVNMGVNQCWMLYELTLRV